MAGFEAGMRVEVRDSQGHMHRKRVLRGPVMGGDFLVVWTCREEEWEAASAEGREPEGVPWSAEDVELIGE